jgi:hypothetical protein
VSRQLFSLEINDLGFIFPVQREPDSKGNMCLRVLYFWAVLSSFFSLSMLGWGQNVKSPTAPRNGGDFSDNVQPGLKVPTGVILVKGAWSSASDSVTPVPEDGNVSNHVFSDPYFGMSYALPSDWEQKYEGPPPSDTGRYVLAQLRPADNFKGPARGNILITAQDMFFSPFPVTNALELVKYSKSNLQADYKIEMDPTPTKIAGRSFTFFAYWSPIAELHWYVLATEIRCHAVEMVLASRDTKLLENLILDLDRMKLPADANPTAGMGGGDVPVCVKDYASSDNVITRVEPVFTEHRFNSVPVRIIIDREGKIKHIHFLSAFPDQAKAITDALGQWKFKPYRREGKPVEVETGIMFGRAQHLAARPAVGAPTD